MKNLKILSLSITILLLASCFSATVMRKAQSKRVPRGSSIGIIVPEGRQTYVSIFLGSALMDRGYNVKMVNPSDVIPPRLLNTIMPGQKYSVMRSFNKLFANGGKLKGNPDSMKEILNVNETTEARSRYNEIMGLLNDFIKNSGIQYLLFVDFNTEANSYLVQITEAQSKSIVFNYYLSGDEEFINKVVSKVKKSKNYILSETDTYGKKLIQICEYIADQIK